MVLKAQLEPAAILTSGLSLAGLDAVGVLDMLPKSVLLPIVLAMFGIIWYFAKRDWARVNTTIEGTSAAVRDLGKKVDAYHSVSLVQFGECVKVKDSSDSFNRLYERVNLNDRRIVRLETKAGLLDNISDLGTYEDEKVKGEKK